MNLLQKYTSKFEGWSKREREVNAEGDKQMRENPTPLPSHRARDVVGE